MSEKPQPGKLPAWLAPALAGAGLLLLLLFGGENWIFRMPPESLPPVNGPELHR